MKVSVIIPVYNVEAHLEECLKSVTGQSLRDLEILCVDDGSSDGSLAILKKAADEDSRIRVFAEVNAGASAARNRALEEARGEYVAFMDADDFYVDEKVLEDLVLAAEKHEADLAMGAIRLLKPQGQTKTIEAGDWTKPAPKGILSTKDYPYDQGFTKFLYSMRLIKAHELRFPAYKRWEDPVFLVKALSKANRIASIGRDTYVYRVEWRKGESKKAYPIEVYRDTLKANAEMIGICEAAGLKAVRGTIAEFCKSDDFSGFLGERIYDDSELFAELCRLEILIGELPIMARVRVEAREGRKLIALKIKIKSLLGM